MDIDKIINEVEEMHPYKKAGDRDSYSQYAEGWSDACDILREHIKQYLSDGNTSNSENTNCAIFSVIASLLIRFKLWRKHTWFSLRYPVNYTHNLTWIIKYNTYLGEVHKLRDKLNSL